MTRTGDIGFLDEEIPFVGESLNELLSRAPRALTFGAADVLSLGVCDAVRLPE